MGWRYMSENRGIDWLAIVGPVVVLIARELASAFLRKGGGQVGAPCTLAAYCPHWSGRPERDRIAKETQRAVKEEDSLGEKEGPHLGNQ